MGVVDGLSKARMLAIEAASIVSGTVNGSGRLILTKQSGATIDAGYVVGPDGADSFAPTGFVGEWFTATPPTGWLICDGTEKAVATYPALATILGTVGGPLTNGSGGVGTTHFRVPNYKGKTAVGFDSTQVEFDALGETGGAKTHVLVTAEMPSHNHGTNTGNATVTHSHSGHPHTHTTPATAVTNTDAAHEHDIAHTHSTGSAMTANSTGTDVASPVGGTTYGIDVSSTSGAVSFTISGSSNNHSHTLGTTPSGSQNGGVHGHTTPAMTTNGQTNTAETGTNDITHAHSITSNGSGTAHNNLQPYIVVHKIIKT